MNLIKFEFQSIYTIVSQTTISALEVYLINKKRMPIYCFTVCILVYILKEKMWRINFLISYIISGYNLFSRLRPKYLTESKRKNRYFLTVRFSQILYIIVIVVRMDLSWFNLRHKSAFNSKSRFKSYYKLSQVIILLSYINKMNFSLVYW